MLQESVPLIRTLGRNATKILNLWERILTAQALKT